MPLIQLMFWVLLVFLLAPAGARATWTIQPPDIPKNFSNMLSRAIAIDRTTNLPHIVYGSDHLYHAYYNGSAWGTETVDSSPGVGQYAAIAIDSLGKIHVSYYDSTNGDLKYATNALGAWVCVTLDSGYVGFFSSIAVDGNNKVHISYRDNSAGTLKYISNSSGSWVIATVDSSGNEGYYSSIAVDSANKAHISYYDSMNGGIRYATNSSGIWAWTEVEAAGGTYTSIAVDSANKVHISYGGNNLRYATNSSGSWVATMVDAIGSNSAYTSIAVDANRKAYISYFDQTNVDLKYATNASGSWVATAIDGSGGTGNVGQYSSIAIDSSNRAHISYYDILNKAMKYTTNGSGSWVSTAIDSAGSVGEYSSIAVDSSNKVHISYYDSNNGSDGNLKYATNTSGAWVTTTVDATGDVGQYSSIALDSNGKVHISYYDVTNTNLKYATNSSGSWAISTISNVSDIGKYSSIAVDSANKVHISYYYYDGASTTALQYRTNSSGSWVTTTIETGTSIGWYTSIAVDSSNKAHISYCDLSATAFDLKYATNASGSWVTSTVDSAAKVTMQTAIGVDSNGKVHIAYHDSIPNYDLKYATNASGSWVLTTVDSANNVGQEASLAVDSNNKIHISYYDQTSLSLKYATNSSGSWSTFTLDEAGYVGKYTSIARDSANKVHISYYDETNQDLKYITNAPIDITPPTGTVTIKSGAVYSTSSSVPLTLTCGDLQSSCSQMQFSNDNASWSTAQTYVTGVAAWSLSSGDGTKTVYARFKDSSGNWSDPVSDTIVLDSTAPTGTAAINSGASLTNSATVSLAVSCSDTGSGCDLMRFSNDNATWTVYAFTTPMPWTLSTGDGTKTVYVQFHDTAGNWSGSVSKTITLDTASPTGTLLFSPNAAYATGKDVTLALTCSDATSGCSQMRFSNNGTTWSPPAGFAASYSWDLNNSSYGGATTEGSKTVYAQFQDTAGNWSSQIISRSITLDTAKPTGSLTINTGDTYAVSKDVTLSTACTDATSGCFQMRFSNNGTLWSAAVAFAPGYAWDLHNPSYGGSTTDGSKTVYAQYQDTAGNWSAAVSSTITLDTAAPVGTLQINSNATYTTSATVTLSLACGDVTSGCAQMRFSNNGSVWSPATSYSSSYLWDITGSSYGGTATEGTKSVYVQFQDMAGTWSGSVTKSISLDTTVPTGTVQFAPAGQYTTTKDVTLSLSCSDSNGCSLMQFSNDGATWSPSLPFAATSPWDINDALYGGGSGDGSKTVFARFRDIAGNWSSSIIKRSITLDRVAPVGSILINSGATYTNTTNVTLELTCSDATSGCATMEFNNDSGSWSTPEAYAAAKTWALASVDGSRTVAVRLTDSAGKSRILSTGIILDSTAPVSLATPDGSGSQAAAVSVTLSCSDGSGSGCAATYYTTDGTVPSASSSLYTVPIAISGLTSPVQLKYLSIDTLGNTEAVKTTTYSFTAGYTSLTLDVASPTLVQGGNLDVSGKLTRYPDSEATPNNGMDLSGLPVVITIAGPAGSPCESGCIENTVTYSSLGHYHLQGINRFSYKGTYGITASFAGTGLHLPASSNAQSLLVGASAGYAVIVEGKVAGDEGLTSHNKTVSRVYETLKERGFVDDNIMYFNYAGIVVPGVDAVPSKSAVQDAIQTWAKERMNGSPAPLYLIMVDHGNTDTFYLDPDTITPAELNSWLETLESNLNTLAKQEKRIVILGACYSGSFIGNLTKAAVPGVDGGRIVISSAAANEQSYRGPNEPDGIRSGEFFIEELFKQLKKGLSFMAAFTEAATQTRTYTAQGSGVVVAANGYGDTSVQHPLLDDNGDGIGSNTLVDGAGDGVDAALAYLGFGLTNASLGPADIKTVTSTAFLPSSGSTTTSPLWLEPYSSSAVSSAWLEIKAPATTLAGDAGSSQLALDLPTTSLELQVSGKWTPAAGTDPTFTTAGRYEVFYFTKSTNAEISEMKRSVVYKNRSSNTPPATFNLLAPDIDGGTPQRRTEEINLVWENSSDADGVTYTVQVATDNDFTAIAYQKEELTSTWHYIDSSALNDQTTYYWRVLAVDGYGEIRYSNQIWSFKTDNTNALPGRIRGYVYDNATPSGAGIANATVTVKAGSTVVAQALSGTGGAFVFVVPSGSYTLSAAAAGYLDGTGGSFSLTSGGTTDTTVTVTVSTPTLQVATAGSGSGTVSGSGGIACTSGSASNCSAPYGNGAVVTLTATPDWKSLFGGWSGAYSGGTNPLDVTMSYHKSLTASFTPNLQARVGGSDYATLQGAYNAATEGATVKAKVYTFQEHLILDQDRTVTFDGGKDGAYGATTGTTTVQGSITVNHGRLNVINLLVK